VECCRKRADGHAANPDGVKLLETIERARLGFALERGEGAERNQLSIRPFDISVLKLAGIEARDAFELRDDFVAQAVEIETIYEISADERGKVRADGFHVEAHGGDLVAVQNQFDFGLIQLRVQGRRESEHSAGGGLSL